MSNIYEWNDPFAAGRRWRENYDTEQKILDERDRQAREITRRIEEVRERQCPPDPLVHDLPAAGPFPHPRRYQAGPLGWGSAWPLIPLLTAVALLLII